jgi:hypothetical protein
LVHHPLVPDGQQLTSVLLVHCVKGCAGVGCKDTKDKVHVLGPSDGHQPFLREGGSPVACMPLLARAPCLECTPPIHFSMGTPISVLHSAHEPSYNRALR